MREQAHGGGGGVGGDADEGRGGGAGGGGEGGFKEPVVALAKEGVGCVCEG